MFYANDIRQKALPLIFGWLLKKSQKIEKFSLKLEKLLLISAIESEIESRANDGYFYKIATFVVIF